jgi:hypothetical protein
VISDDERVTMKQLCEQISNERDDATFIELVRKLNDLLDKKPVTLDKKPSV